MAAAVSSPPNERLSRADACASPPRVRFGGPAFSMLVPPLLTASVGTPAGCTLQEAIDLLTPLIVIPLAWYVFDLSGGRGRRASWRSWSSPRPGSRVRRSTTWPRMRSVTRSRQVPSTPTSKQQRASSATGWTVSSHWLWHVAGWPGLSFCSRPGAEPWARGRPTRRADGRGRRRRIYGMTFFIVTVEGATTLLGIPASIALLAWSASLARHGLAGRPSWCSSSSAAS